MKDYEINDATIAILPEVNGQSKVMEGEYEYQVNLKPLSIVDYSCRYFGSSYPGRKDGARSILNSCYKLPILIAEAQNIIFFPTLSPDDSECAWISLNQIKMYQPSPDGLNNTVVEFKNGKKMQFDVSYKSFENQLLRASRLESVIRSRN